MYAGNTPRKALSQVAAAMNTWCEAASPRVAAQRQPDSRPHSMPPPVLHQIQFLGGKPSFFPSVQRAAEQHRVFLQQGKEGQTCTLHACLSTLMSCMSRMRNTNEQLCFFQLVCYVHYSKKNNKPSIVWFLSLCTKQFGESVHPVQSILCLSLVKFMKVNDMAQITACSRTFTLDNPLETQCASQHILQRSNNFFRTLIIPYHLPRGDSYQWMKNNCQVRTTPGSRGNKLLRMPESLAHNIWERTKCLRMQSTITISPKKREHTLSFVQSLPWRKKKGKNNHPCMLDYQNRTRWEEQVRESSN